MGWLDNLIEIAKNRPKPIDVFQKVWIQNGGELNEINIFGIRNESANRRKDEFCDKIGIMSNGEIKIWTGTVDPSVWWTDNPVTVENVTGAGHVCYGYHKNIWQIGAHYDQNPALIQTGAAIKIWRDVNKNHNLDSNEPIQTGWYGMNFHCAMGSPTIGKWSAGCQVIQKKSDFDEAMNIVMNSDSYKKNKKFKFSYMLFSDKQLKNIL